MRLAVDPKAFERIFGPREDGPKAGRFFTCRHCGEVHQRGRVPHNCRDVAPPRADFATPMIAPGFEPFRTGLLPGAEVINDRREKQEYMRKNDLVEYDEGVTNELSWAEEKELEREIMLDLKRFAETDTDYYTPDLKAERLDEGGSLEEGTEIDASGIEVAK